MKSTTTNAVSTPAIETKIASNGNINVYVNGKRMKESDAVLVAMENNLPFYSASILTYAGNSVIKEFVSAITAYKWLRQMANKSQNYSDGSSHIERYADNDSTNVFKNSGSHIEINDDELKDYIDARNAKEHIDSMYRVMLNTVKFYGEQHGLTVEQAEQVVAALYGNKISKDTLAKMISDFKAANTAAVNAEIENANKADEVITVEVETPADVAEPSDAEAVKAAKMVVTLLAEQAKTSDTEHKLHLHKQITEIIESNPDAIKIIAAAKNDDNDDTRPTNEPAANTVGRQYNSREKVFGDDTVTILNGGKIVNIFSAKYNAQIIKENGSISYRIVNDNGAKETVTPDEFFKTLEQRGACKIGDAKAEVEPPAKFETGKTYHCYDWINDCAGKDTITITKRTAKTVIVSDSRYKIKTDSQGEYIEPYKGYFQVTVRAEHCADDPIAELDPAEYAISDDAFNFMVAAEIEDAEQAAFEAKIRARTLANETLAARYADAKKQVKCKRYENGVYGWWFKGKNSDEWEHDGTKAAACLTRYGLHRHHFAIFHDAEQAAPEFTFNVARFNDDFIAQRDELKAKFDAAQDALIVAQDNFDDAENALRKFFNKAANALWDDFRQAQATLGDKTIEIERQSGSRKVISADSDVYIDIHGGDKFAIVDGNSKTIARYDTPAQVKAVINKFATAIKRGDKLFIFPTAEELNA